MGNNLNSSNQSLQAQIVAQWITSLAISVVCCAILFIVFAGYIVELHDTTNLLTVKLEVMQERQNQLVSEISYMKRPTVVQINGTQAVEAAKAPEAPAAGGQPSAAPAADGGNAPPADAVKADTAPKDDLMPIMNEAVPEEQVIKPAKEPHMVPDPKASDEKAAGKKPR